MELEYKFMEVFYKIIESQNYTDFIIISNFSLECIELLELHKVFTYCC